MPKKSSVTKEKIFESAFQLVREKGMEEFSARRVAEAAGCSTQPIFRAYANMGELEEEIFRFAADLFSARFEEEKSYSRVPFVNFGMTYISFAREEPHLFRMLFINENILQKSMYELVNGGSKNIVIKEIRNLEGLSPDEAGPIFMKVWLFIHGIACMIVRNDFDIPEDEMVSLLKETFGKFYEK
ncbi:MAG: TetR/AcrR family transcriptional regulator [Lachnospiraceae bacterium]|nr:TetR/AcrR family transcriptional regulator [Lachnospiraceae bacterium]